MFLSRSFSSSTLLNSYNNLPKSVSLQTLLKRGYTPSLKSINKFLLFLSQTRRFNSIIYFFSQMNSEQIKGNSQTHSIFTWALLKLHKFEEAEDFMNAQMRKNQFSPKSRMFDLLIQGFCIKRNNPEKALLVLKSCLRNHGTLPSSFTFCSLIYSFSSSGNMNRAVEVLELMADENVKYPFDNFVCSSVISGFCKIGKPEFAIGFFEKATGLGALRPNVVSYTALVSALCKLGRVNEVNDLVSRMENEGLIFDVIFFSSWIYGCFREGNLLKAFRKHRKMVDQGIKMDAISYTILIDGFSKEGHVEKAVGILNKMIKDGLRPNLITYTAIILGFCKKGKLEEAFNVFKKVEDLGIVVDEFIYATLIDGVCRKGDLDYAFHLLEEMEKKGIEPTIVTYNTIMNGLCKVGRTSEADEVSKGILGDVVTYSTLLHGYIKEDNMKGIIETKQRLEEMGIQMDVVMCNILIKALFMVGALEDAHAVYHAMPEMDLVANSVTYCTMIEGYCKLGRIDEALEIFDDFRGTSHSSVACYNCIINGLCRKGMVDFATEFLIELDEKGLVCDLGIFKTLFEAAFTKDGVDGVLNLVYKVQNLGSWLCDVMYSTLISFLCKKGYSEAAIRVWLIMRRQGSVVTSKSYCSLLKGLTVDGRRSLIGPMLNILVKEYGPVEPSIIKMLIHYLCLNNVKSALQFIKKRKDNASTVTFSVSVLKELIKDGRVLDAYKLVMGAEGNLPYMDVFDYSLIVASLCKEGHLSKALDICAFMTYRGTALNILTYNSLIKTLCRQGCLVEAFRLFDSLEKIDLAPSEVTYITLIDSLCKEGFLLDAKQLLERLVLKGFNPSTRIYNLLIDGYCKLGRMEEASKFLHDLEIRCLKPDEFTVSAVINGFCLKGEMEGALGQFFEFKRQGTLPDFLGFLYLIRGLSTKGRMEESRSILREMLQSKSVLELINGVDSEVESESVLKFLFSLCEQGSIREAISILDEIGSIYFPVRRFSTDSVSQTPNRLYECEACASSSEKNDLEMVENSYNVGNRAQVLDFDFCYSQIASLCLKGELQKANGVVKEMLSRLNTDS
ncbi:pentatricopeptide repeat-containing protein At5g57250, mitochondrial [Mangifera indica]|uniref:pentatricopeptide repeat-containing protein At5g57250, mitochondrial n=1 Tax=Mangifera indica TaxID=29780 RepID=UPI001CFA7742|nr:pentatricopeptide repeat-containing protein At5g57250, mitochondrial [Mangifera indica]XP_044472264.1 pentatricopeptide repeat-containing protein At5g57250, mitochondrial [Mangifera indica]XP_044472265.1 pentatricopeptide repeat-containing protein At5g57250, mitochondrial [Mangifera indica]XP_044472266.1 pentatricopeptide repeat-containing protein At5g57250, mitochondrial [Mangifera indica]XP_044472268.1 pentatricopeptide repeat-containing protein At5g57250, mitochondrial [Mangifera indica]